MNLLDYLKSAKQSLYRLETLQYYKESDESQLQDFLKTGEIDLTTNNDWYDFLESKRRDNVKTQRIRLIKNPISDYVRFELEFHKEAKKHGDEILIADIDLIDEELFDFWLIDDKLALKLNYINGEFKSFDLIEDELEVKALENLYNSILTKSEKLV